MYMKERAIPILKLAKQIHDQDTHSAQLGSVVVELSQDAHMINTAGTAAQEYAACYSG